MRRRRFVAAASLAVGSALASACSPTYSFGSDASATRGSGKVVQQTTPIHDVSAIEVGGVGRLEVLFDLPESLIVEAEDNIMPLVTSDLQNGTLVLGLRPNASIATSKGITYKVTSPRALESLKMTGSTSARVTEIKGPPRVKFSLDGSSKATVGYLYADSIEVDLHGSSELTVSGEAVDQQVIVEDSASYVADKFQTATATVATSNSGKAVVSVAKSLSATAQNSGTVKYIGSPSVSKQVKDSAKVEPK